MSTTQRLPTPGGDNGDWGDILNGFLGVAHNDDGSLRTAALASAGLYIKPNGGIPASDLGFTPVETVNGKSGTSLTLAASDIGALTESIADGRYPQSGAYVTPGDVSAAGSLQSTANVRTIMREIGVAVLNVTDATYGADPTGVADSTAAIKAAMTAALNMASPSTTVYIAKAAIYLPPGTYKVTSDLAFLSVQGCKFFGAGEELTIIEASGTGFTNAVININGSSYSSWSDFTIRGDGTEQAPVALMVQWDNTIAARSTSQNRFSDIKIRNIKCVTGVSIANPHGEQNDGNIFDRVSAAGGQAAAGSWSSSGNWQNGFLFGSGIEANNYDHVLRGCNTSNWYYGYTINPAACEISGIEPASNYADFHIEQPSGQLNVNNVQSQNSSRFIVGNGGSSTEIQSFRDILWSAGQLNSDGKIVTCAAGTSAFEFSNMEVTNVPNGTTPVLYFDGQGNPEVVTLINFQMPAPVSSAVTTISGTGSVVAVNYVQTNSSGQVGTVTGLWTSKAQFFAQGLAAARPTAAIVGNSWYWATDAQALSHSSGSAWTTITSASIPYTGYEKFYPGYIGWHSGETLATGTRTSGLVFNDLVLTLMHSGPSGITISAVSTYVQTAGAGDVYRVGFYRLSDQADPFNWSSSSVWATLLLDVGVQQTLACSATGGVGLVLSTPLAIPANTWFAVGGAMQGTNSGAQLMIGNYTAGLFSPLGLAESPSAGLTAGISVAPYIALYEGSVSGALPANFTPGSGSSLGHGVAIQRSA